MTKLIDKEQKLISKDAYLAISSDLVEDMNTFLEEKREKGELPSGIREQFIQDLIERGRCICGTTLAEGDVHVEHLNSLLGKTVKKSVEDGFLKLNAFTDKSLTASDEFIEKLADIHEQKTSLSSKIETVTMTRMLGFSAALAGDKAHPSIIITQIEIKIVFFILPPLIVMVSLFF